MTEITDPRYDSKPTQPKYPGEMTREEEDALFDATLGRDDVADSVWEAVVDQMTPDKWRDVVRYLFRHGGNFMSDRSEAARLLIMACGPRVEQIVDDESHNTDMGKGE